MQRITLPNKRNITYCTVLNNHTRVIDEKTKHVYYIAEYDHLKNKAKIYEYGNLMSRGGVKQIFGISKLLWDSNHNNDNDTTGNNSKSNTNKSYVSWMGVVSTWNDDIKRLIFVETHVSKSLIHILDVDAGQILGSYVCNNSLVQSVNIIYRDLGTYMVIESLGNDDISTKISVLELDLAYGNFNSILANYELSSVVGDHHSNGGYSPTVPTQFQHVVRLGDFDIFFLVVGSKIICIKLFIDTLNERECCVTQMETIDMLSMGTVHTLNFLLLSHCEDLTYALDLQIENTSDNGMICQITIDSKSCNYKTKVTTLDHNSNNKNNTDQQLTIPITTTNHESSSTKLIKGKTSYLNVVLSKTKEKDINTNWKNYITENNLISYNGESLIHHFFKNIVNDQHQFDYIIDL